MPNQPFHDYCATCKAPKPLSASEARQKEKERQEKEKMTLFKMRFDAPNRRYLFEAQEIPEYGMWECLRCTVINSSLTVSCVSCNTPCSVILPWSCAKCSYRNTTHNYACTMCSANRPPPDLSLYTCVQCSVQNDPQMYPVRCGVCAAVRYDPIQCRWLAYNQLSLPIQRLAYDLLPDILTTLHTLHPRCSLAFSGDTPPSLTT